MKRRSYPMLAVLLLVALGLLLGGCFFGAPPANGSVTVMSNPVGMKILLDDKDTGKVTPAEISGPPGPHVIKLVKAGVEDRVLNVVLKSGEKSLLTSGDVWASIKGVVTDTRGGAALAGVTVAAGDVTATTDADGSFTLKVLPGSYDVRASMAGYGTAVMGSFAVKDEDGGRTIDIPTIVIRKAFNPSASLNPPSVDVPGGIAGSTVSGDVSFEAEIAGVDGNYIRNVDWRLGSIDGLVRDGRQWDAGTETTEYEVAFNAGAFPLGATTLYLTAYDYNYNSTTVIIPLVIAGGGGTAETLAAPDAYATAYTYSKAIGYFSKPSLAAKGLKVGTTQGKVGTKGLEVGPVTNRTMYVDVAWAPVPGATSYKVYRSTEPDAGFVPVATSWTTRTDSDDNVECYWRDGSPNLAVGRTVYYKVQALDGDVVSGLSSATMTKPLPPMNVTLDAPSNTAYVSDLTPVLSWNSDDMVGFDNVIKSFQLFVWDTNSDMNWNIYVEDYAPHSTTHAIRYGSRYGAGFHYNIMSPVSLKYARRYEWDVYSGMAYSFDDPITERVTAVSISGDDPAFGSMNGSFTFLTPVGEVPADE